MKQQVSTPVVVVVLLIVVIVVAVVAWRFTLGKKGSHTALTPQQMQQQMKKHVMGGQTPGTAGAGAQGAAMPAQGQAAPAGQ